MYQFESHWYYVHSHLHLRRDNNECNFVASIQVKLLWINESNFIVQRELNLHLNLNSPDKKRFLFWTSAFRVTVKLGQGRCYVVAHHGFRFKETETNAFGFVIHENAWTSVCIALKYGQRLVSTYIPSTHASHPAELYRLQSKKEYVFIEVITDKMCLIPILLALQYIHMHTHTHQTISWNYKMNIFNWNQLGFAYAVFTQVSHFNAIEKYKWKEQNRKTHKKDDEKARITRWLRNTQPWIISSHRKFCQTKRDTKMAFNRLWTRDRSGFIE